MKVFRKIRNYYYFLIKGRESPERIARGMAIGVFIAFSPFLGLHTLLCIFLSLIFNGSKTASLFGSFLFCNPISIPVIYFSEFEVGKYIMKIFKLEVDILTLSDFKHITFKALIEIGKSVFIPVFIGSVVLGGIFAIIAYIFSKKYFQKVFADAV